jgi:SAM-dependent methyltransferase
MIFINYLADTIYKVLNNFVNFLKQFLKFIKSYQEFKKLNLDEKWKLKLYPCLYDGNQNSGSLGEYFYQDLFVTQKILENNFSRHIDIGSRLDGFIGNLSLSRNIEVIDIRPLDFKIKNVKFTQIDINKVPREYYNVADCVTILHTLEHIGLGRYGDEIDPDGWTKTLNNISKILKNGGILWLSVPSGSQRIEFNAHRIFDPKTLVRNAQKYQLEIKKFYFFEYENPKIIESRDFKKDFDRIAALEYCLGIYCFEKA